MLGRFLELSLTAPTILESWQYYQRLGFVAATDGGVWEHPYAALTDGRVTIGLHGAGLSSTSLTYVQPGLAAHVARLTSLGVGISRAALGEEAFNEAWFESPDGQSVRLLEARTYSPPAEAPLALLGWFEEIALPVRDLDAARRYWEQLGFVATAEAAAPWPHLALTSDTLNIGLHATRALSGPTLVFSSENVVALRERLAALGILPERQAPAGLDPAVQLWLRAPEGTSLWVGPPG